MLVLLFLPQTTAGGAVVALAGLPFSEEGERSRRFRKKMPGGISGTFLYTGNR